MALNIRLTGYFGSLHFLSLASQQDFKALFLQLHNYSSLVAKQKKQTSAK
jgi:hypothetical protein